MIMSRISANSSQELSQAGSVWSDIEVKIKINCQTLPIF